MREIIFAKMDLRIVKKRLKAVVFVHLCFVSHGAGHLLTNMPFPHDLHFFPTQMVHESSTLFQCPSVCFCNVLSRIVYCSRRNLDEIPVNISSTSLQINLSGNKFADTTLRRLNFSTFDHLVHLYLSECGVRFLERSAFSDLQNLKWLDLSNNQLQLVPEGAFRGLRLQYLFLNGNKNIQIIPTSFSHLSTFGLYLHECSLVNIDVSVLMPLKNNLKFLWLNANQIKSLSEDLLPIFNGLDHVRLSSNPFHCNCNLLWLKKFFDERMDVFKGVPAPTCSTPARVKLKSLDVMLPTDISCTPPTFGDIELSIKPGWGCLKCRASGDPPPTLYWIQPSGRTSKFMADESLSKERYDNEGMIIVGNDEGDTSTDKHNSQLLEGTYICVARNEAGNSTLSVNISLRFQPTHDDESAEEDATRPSTENIFMEEGSDARETEQMVSVSDDDVDSGPKFKDDRRKVETHLTRDNMFSSYELSCAVFLTHFLTLVICIFIISKIYRCRVKPGNSLEKPAAFGFATGMTYPENEREIAKKDLHVNQHGHHFFPRNNWNNGLS